MARRILQKNCSKEFHRIHRKMPVLESFLNKDHRLELYLKRLCVLKKTCFPVNFAKFSKTFFITPVNDCFCTCNQGSVQYLAVNYFCSIRPWEAENCKPCEFIGKKPKGWISKPVFWGSKVSQIFRKPNISYPLIHICTCAYQGVWNVCFSENLACFVFLKHPFWDLPFWLITDELIVFSFFSH